MAPKVQINVEKLISLVENNPVIYDKRNRDHKDINVLANVWDSIANAMNITDCKYFFSTFVFVDDRLAKSDAG